MDILLAISKARSLTSGDSALFIASASKFAAFFMETSSLVSGSNWCLFNGSGATPIQNILSAQ